MEEHLKLAKEVCSIVGTSLASFFSTDQTKPGVEARRLYCSVLIERGFSIRGLATFLERDRATIYNYHNKHKDYVKYDEEYRKLYEKTATYAEEIDI